MKKISAVCLATVAIAFAGNTAGGDPDFKGVSVTTKTLTMTGMREPEPESTPRDYTFKPVHVTTKPLIMTGVAD